ncbi:MAG: calcium-binding protein, partial [Dolichospermum sp.]
GDTGSEMVLSTYAGTEGFYGSAYRYNSAYSAELDRVDFSGINRFQITGTGTDDSITTGGGNDTINGGDDNDTINAGGGNDTVNAGAGDDTINSGTGVDTLDGGDGSDSLILNLSAQTGNIVINNATAGINLTGIVTATNFEIFTITTGSGNDTIITQSGLVNNIVVRYNDTINSGAGNDTINTGLGIDVANGGAGDDLLIIDYSIDDTGSGMGLSTSAGTEGFSGIAFRNNSTGSNTQDRVDFSGINRFQITGTAANDSITTGSGNDTINAGAGNDDINGGAGNDTINGGDDNDTINAGGGNDTVNAGAGDDTVDGGAGVDTLDGGDGSDSLILDLSAQTGNILINNATAGINLTVIVTSTYF